MAGKIQLTPAELLAQSQEMLSLQNEFQSLFTQTENILGQVNQNWSTNLANNFAGKLTSAQKSFAQIVSLLQQGGTLAATSAKTFESMDSLLSKVMSGDAVSSIAGSIGGVGVAGAAAAAGAAIGNAVAGIDWSSVGNTISDFGEYAWEQLKRDWANAGESMEWLGEQYSKLPEEVRGKIEKALGGTLTTAISTTYDIITGNVTWDTAYDVIGEIFEGSSTGKAIIGTLKEVFEGDAIERQGYYDQLAMDQIKQGNILSGVTTQLGAFTDTILIGSVDILGDIAMGVVEDLPLVGLLTDAIGVDLSDGWNNIMASAHEGMNTVITNVSESIGEFEEAARETIGNVIDTGKEVVSDVIDKGKEVVSDIVDTGKEVVDNIKDTGKNIYKAAGNALDNIGDGLKSGWNKIFG